eukprot:CAMPEP_0172320282 /NCGR_PEP_ID=MMETSP1058-20130122/40181_1 /TAXON_ID=83371 /ORGANISM="Detonula confervacea, Strain CCMP 353" /LENGTH=451 /DNA_ID=CAMNT_0013035515 /DNA_START=96 /DNA_END=1451 /DNA_ORIENTATION=-
MAEEGETAFASSGPATSGTKTAETATATDPTEHEGCGWLVEEGNGGLPSPPQGLFQVMGHLSNVQMNASRANAPSVESEYDDSSIVEADEEGYEEIGVPDATTADVGFFESCTSVVDKVLYPTFNSNGNFVGYEARGNQKIQRSDHDVVSQPNTHNKKYAAMLTFLLFFVAVVSVVYLAWDNERPNSTSSSENVDHEILDYAQITSTTDTNNKTPSKQYHTHPEKEHTPRQTNRPTVEPTIPSKHHTHPQKDHTPRRTESPTASSSSIQDFTSLSDSASSYPLRIPATAVATIKKSHPDDKRGGLQELAVERDERISLIRFDLSSIISDNDVVSRATLKLYLKTHNGDHTTTSVDMLPHGGEWTDQSVSWNNPPNSKESYSVTTFDVAGLPDGVTTHLIEVDVTSAINYEATQNEWVTFKLVAKSSGDLWFASKGWNGGEAVPELVITLAE